MDKPVNITHISSKNSSNPTYCLIHQQSHRCGSFRAKFYALSFIYLCLHPLLCFVLPPSIFLSFSFKMRFISFIVEEEKSVMGTIKQHMLEAATSFYLVRGEWEICTVSF